MLRRNLGMHGLGGLVAPFIGIKIIDLIISLIISPAYAKLQIRRVAEKNHLPADQVSKLVDDYPSGRIIGFIGEPRVSVLRLNIALEELAGR